VRLRRAAFELRSKVSPPFPNTLRYHRLPRSLLPDQRHYFAL